MAVIIEWIISSSRHKKPMAVWIESDLVPRGGVGIVPPRQHHRQQYLPKCTRTVIGLGLLLEESWTWNVFYARRESFDWGEYWKIAFMINARAGNISTKSHHMVNGLMMGGWMNGYFTIPHIITLTVCVGHYYLFQFLESTRRLTGSTSRTMSAMSLGFIVMVTPWTIQEVVAACTGSKVFILCPISSPIPHNTGNS